MTLLPQYGRAPMHRLPACLAALLLVVCVAACGSTNKGSSNTGSAAATGSATVAAELPAASGSLAVASATSPGSTPPQGINVSKTLTPVAAIARGTPSNLSGTLTVLAAASLTDAFNQEGQAFQQANPKVTVKFPSGAPSALEAQLAQGAPADIFASADQANMDKATKDNVIDGGSQIFAKNKVVVVVPKGNPANIQSVADLA